MPRQTPEVGSGCVGTIGVWGETRESLLLRRVSLLHRMTAHMAAFNLCQKLLLPCGWAGTSPVVAGCPECRV